MYKATRVFTQRKEKLLRYILNNKEGISNLYKYQKELHGCSAEGHISHLYSARLSSRPLGWKVINVNNVSKLRLVKADNKEIKDSINFNPVVVPMMQFGNIEEKHFSKIY